MHKILILILIWFYSALVAMDTSLQDTNKDSSRLANEFYMTLELTIQMGLKSKVDLLLIKLAQDPSLLQDKRWLHVAMVCACEYGEAFTPILKTLINEIPKTCSQFSDISSDLQAIKSKMIKIQDQHKDVVNAACVARELLKEYGQK